MKLKQAILLAKKHKCRIRSHSLAMHEQSAKSLAYWLFVDESATAESLVEATDWELEGQATYHVRYIKNCEAKLRSFISDEARTIFLDNFKENHDDDYIDLVFDGIIKQDLLSGGK